MLSLISSMKEKSSLVVIDNSYLTWLEDTEFDYLNHKCQLKYLRYELYSTNKVRDIQDFKDSRSYKHMEYIEDSDNKQYIQVRYNFGYLTKQINLGDNLVIFEIDSNELIEYSIDSWVNLSDKNCDNVFSLSKLYDLYKNYCFYDLHTKFSGHEPGYQYIQYESEGFKNLDARLRRKYKLKTWKSDPIENHYRDVRVYKYFEYLDRIQVKTSSENLCLDQSLEPNKIVNQCLELSDKLFKYRKLAFESYLFCHVMQRNVPIDYVSEWNKLGKYMYYIKIGDKNLPMFVKAEWKLDNELRNSQTWRRI